MLLQRECPINNDLIPFKFASSLLQPLLGHTSLLLCLMAHVILFWKFLDVWSNPSDNIFIWDVWVVYFLCHCIIGNVSILSLCFTDYLAGYIIQGPQSISIRTLNALPPCLLEFPVATGKSDTNLIFIPWHVASFSSSLGKFLDFSISSLEFWHRSSIWIQGWFLLLLFIHLFNPQQIVLIWRLLTFFNSQQLCKVLFPIYK